MVYGTGSRTSTAGSTGGVQARVLGDGGAVSAIPEQATSQASSRSGSGIPRAGHAARKVTRSGFLAPSRYLETPVYIVEAGDWPSAAIRAKKAGWSSSSAGTGSRARFFARRQAWTIIAEAVAHAAR